MTEAQERAAVVAEARTWAIYALTDADGVVRYVGKSADAAKRYKQHLTEAAWRKQPVHVWLTGLAAAGERPGLVIIETGNGDWRVRERHWIAQHKATALNLSRGGNEPVNTPESRAAMRAKLKGRVFTEEWRRKISIGKTGKARPDAVETMRRVAAQNRGKKMQLSPEERRRRALSCRAIPRRHPPTEREKAATALKVAASWAAMQPEQRAARSKAISDGRRKALGR
jgi:hypothetical protein